MGGGPFAGQAFTPNFGAFMEPVINVVLPVFAIILSGYVAGRMGVMGQSSTDALNRFVYFLVPNRRRRSALCDIVAFSSISWHGTNAD